MLLLAMSHKYVRWTRRGVASVEVVAPAEAGAQAVNLIFNSRLTTWIPTFVGMTGPPPCPATRVMGNDQMLLAGIAQLIEAFLSNLSIPAPTCLLDLETQVVTHEEYQLFFYRCRTDFAETSRDLISHPAS